MPSEAFVLKNGKKYGPFSTSQLRQLAAAHEIGPDDLIKRDRESLPVPARTLAGLIDAFDTAGWDAPAGSSEQDQSGDWISEVLAQESQSGVADSAERGRDSEIVEPAAPVAEKSDRAVVHPVRENP